MEDFELASSQEIDATRVEEQPDNPWAPRATAVKRERQARHQRFGERMPWPAEYFTVEHHDCGSSLGGMNVGASVRHRRGAVKVGGRQEINEGRF
jgi:hypothetical protein